MNKLSTRAHNLPRFEFIALMAALMGLNALAIDVMLPALPYLGEALNVLYENDRSLVVTFYMIGFGVTQIIFGPLSDRFGRRTPLLIGLVIYIIAAFAAILAPTFGTLLFLRLVQGMGAAGTRVIVLAVVRDCYSGRAMAEIMSLVFMVFMIMPIIAPAVGQVLLLTGPWQAIFLFMGGLGCVISFWALMRLPETLALDKRRPLKLSVILEGFAIVCRNRMAMGYAMAGTFIFGIIMGFVNTAQQIYVGIYELGALFPLAFGATALLQAVASFLNAQVVGRFGMRRIAHTAVLIFLVNSLIWWATTVILGKLSFPVLYAFMGLNLFLFSWIATNANSLSMEPLGAVAGTASGLFGSFQTILGAGLGYGISQMFDGTVTPVAAGFALMALGTLVCMLFAEKGKLFGTGEEQDEIPNKTANS
ncbi:MAG: multidrug effflux MFS transporter [Rhizobiales bacterium]|nr:multidrug effflux MFS transporter [Hyphomicrobiales bacterium]NRB14428.1 multidrug effflux MFS transporter [Hyphomicrobiales bacterium]